MLSFLKKLSHFQGFGELKILFSNILRIWNELNKSLASSTHFFWFSFSTNFKKIRTEFLIRIFFSSTIAEKSTKKVSEKQTETCSFSPTFSVDTLLPLISVTAQYGLVSLHPSQTHYSRALHQSTALNRICWSMRKRKMFYSHK